MNLAKIAEASGWLFEEQTSKDLVPLVAREQRDKILAAWHSPDHTFSDPAGILCISRTGASPWLEQLYW